MGGVVATVVSGVDSVVLGAATVVVVVVDGKVKLGGVGDVDGSSLLHAVTINTAPTPTTNRARHDIPLIMPNPPTDSVSIAAVDRAPV